MRNYLSDPLCPIQFSGHETFPLRQLWLKKAYDAVAGHAPSAPKSIFADEEAIVRFGVGRNMVASIRHWALACEIMEEHEAGYRCTPLGRKILADDGLDPYGEHPSSAWLVHWQLAGKGNRATTWFWVFNHLTNQSFDRDGVLGAIRAFAQTRSSRLSDATLRRDIECFVRSYVPLIGADNPEEISEPVLGELGLIHHALKGAFEFRRGPKKTLNDGMFVYAVVDYWNRVHPNVSTLSFNTIAHEYGSPGRVFKLDENSLAERLSLLAEQTHGRVVWSDAAGMRQLIRREPIEAADLLEGCYE